MKRLQQFLLWLLKLIGWRLPELKEENVFRVPEHISRLLLITKSRVEACREWGGSGEAKRHRVYAQLMKDFPEIAHKDLAFAIELVIQNAG
jgi:hypothetical protein